MRVIITCGPAYEPIDSVRRITNLSTGALGTQIADHLTAHGHTVLCLRGEAATHPSMPRDAEVRAFSTNDDLHTQLEMLARTWNADAVLHAAALCDYRVATVTDRDGIALAAGKIPSRAGALTLTLEPARKVIAGLRTLFPTAFIVGWKYEVDGTRDDAIARAQRQLAECSTDACVVNGPAYGPGFGFCEKDLEDIPHLRGAHTIAEHLERWLIQRVG